MYWIKCIKSIFGYTALYESSIPIILEDNKRCKYRPNYPIVTILFSALTHIIHKPTFAP